MKADNAFTFLIYMAKKLRKLTELDIVEASGVDHPAHLHEGWLLMKSFDDVLDEANAIESADDSLDNTEVITVSEETVEAEAEEEEATEATEPEAVEAIPETEDVVEPEPVTASVDSPEDFKKEMTDLRKRAEEAETLAKAIQHERAVEKAEDRVNGWSYLPQMTEDFTKSLVTLRETLPTEALAVEKVLDAANALLSENISMTQLGTDGELSEESAFGQLEAMAKAAVSDGEFSSYVDALQHVSITNPDLYETHRTEMGRS